jgi:hypothetical protein
MDDFTIFWFEDVLQEKQESSKYVLAVIFQGLVFE